MEFHQSLYRDQQRLAQTKAEALAPGHPLRVRYLEWIAELDLCLDRAAEKGNAPQALPPVDPVASAAMEVSDVDVVNAGGSVEARRLKRRPAEMPMSVQRAKLSRGPARYSQAFAADQNAHASRSTGFADAGAPGAHLEELRRENRILRSMLARFSS